MLIVISVLDSALERDYGGSDAAAAAAASSRLRQRVLEHAWEGLALRGVADRGFSFRILVVGLHEFESRSRAAAAAGEGLVFAGQMEEANSRHLGKKLADLAGELNDSSFYCTVVLLVTAKRFSYGLVPSKVQILVKVYLRYFCFTRHTRVFRGGCGLNSTATQTSGEGIAYTVDMIASRYVIFSAGAPRSLCG